MKKTTKNQVELLPLFQQFINASHKGCHRKQNGTKISKGNVENYENTLRLLQQFCKVKAFDLRIRLFVCLNQREQLAEKKLLEKFYGQFTVYLYNYLGLYMSMPISGDGHGVYPG